MNNAENLMSVSALANAVSGKLQPTEAIGSITGITTDSRSITPGYLFVALAGENFDGHDFIGKAKEAGAIAALVHKDLLNDFNLPTIRVDNTRLALGKLAGWWRDHFKGKLIALTGSNGKTTVKELTAAILREASENPSSVLATEGNFNNDIGMPLTLLKLREHHKYAVIEMGMNHLGEIAYLSRIARPDVALINNAHRAHVGEVGNVENIARAKGEIFEGLESDGIAILNADDAFYSYWKNTIASKNIISFGIREGDIKAEYKESSSGLEVRFSTPGGIVETTLQIPGEHNVRNAAAACAVAIALDIPLAAIAHGLAAYKGTKGRLQKRHGLHGATIIDDTYNANPDSMLAAISVLSSFNGKKIFVMGDMGELGENSPSLHAEIGKVAREANIDTLFATGPTSVLAVEAFGKNAQHFSDIRDLTQALLPLLDKNVVMLV